MFWIKLSSCIWTFATSSSLTYSDSALLTISFWKIVRVHISVSEPPLEGSISLFVNISSRKNCDVNRVDWFHWPAVWSFLRWPHCSSRGVVYNDGRASLQLYFCPLLEVQTGRFWLAKGIKVKKEDQISLIWTQRARGSVCVVTGEFINACAQTYKVTLSVWILEHSPVAAWCLCILPPCSPCCQPSHLQTPTADWTSLLWSQTPGGGSYLSTSILAAEKTSMCLMFQI